MILNQGGGGIVPKQVIDTTTITPGTTEQTIEAQTYLRGDLTVEGEPNLIPENIPVDLSLFGVKGTKTFDIQNGSKATYKAGEAIDSGNFITHDYKSVPDFKYNAEQHKRAVFPGTNYIGVLSGVKFNATALSGITFILNEVDSKGAVNKKFSTSIPAVNSNALGSDYNGSVYIVQILPLDNKRFALVYSQSTGKTQRPVYSTYYENKLGICVYKINDAVNGIDLELNPIRIPNVSMWTENVSSGVDTMPKVTGLLPFTDLETDKRLIMFIDHVPDYNNTLVHNFGHCIVDYNSSTPTVTSITPDLYSICTTQGVDSKQTGKHYKDSKGNYHIVSLSKSMNGSTSVKYTWTYVKVIPVDGVNQVILSPVTILIEPTTTSISNQFIDMWGESSEAGTILTIAYNSYVAGLSSTARANLALLELFVGNDSYVPTINKRKDIIPLSHPLIRLSDRTKWDYTTRGNNYPEEIIPCAAFFLNKNCLLISLYTNTYDGIGTNNVAFAVSTGSSFDALANNFRARLLPAPTSNEKVTLMCDNFVGRNTMQTSPILVLPVGTYISGSGTYNARKDNFVPLTFNCKTDGNYNQIDGISISAASENQDIDIFEIGG